MKFCSQCGNTVEDNQKFCAKCGAVIPDNGASQGQTTINGVGYNQPQYAQQPQYNVQPMPTNNALPMGWYKFLIYFALFASAVIGLGFGIAYLTGTIYTMQDSRVSAELVYALMPSLQTWDVIYGLYMLAVAGFSIYTRMGLAKYKANAPKCVMILYAANALMAIIYSIAASSILSELSSDSGMDATVVTSIIVGVVMVVVNYIYFKKRSHLFVN